MRQNTDIMKIKSEWQIIFILCCTSTIVFIRSFTHQTELNQRNSILQVKKNIQSIETRNDTIRLKYTTGVRSILEDSKGNSWFGSYREGVCRLNNGELQYYTIENGLSDNQVRSIYEDKNGKIWFECGIGLSYYDGQKITIYKQRNYTDKNGWKLNDNDVWFKGDETAGYNKLEGDPGVYQYDGQNLSYRSFPLTPTPGENFTYSISTPFVKAGMERFGLEPTVR